MRSATEVGERVEAKADEAARSDWAERLGRVGLAARGTVYCVVAILAVRVATGDNKTADRQGALHAVARQPFGKLLLAVLALGFLGYAAWRVLRAATGRSEKSAAGARSSPVLVRLGDAAVGIGYVVLFVSTVAMLFGGGGSNEEQRQHTWTARLLSHSYGEWIVGLAGVALVVTGIVLAVLGLRQQFADTLKTHEMNAWQRRWLPRLGLVGYVARGIVIGLIGVFVLRAAMQNDPRESVGVDGALHRLAAQPYGPWLLAVVALGLAAFGAHSFVEARWRRVLDS